MNSSTGNEHWKKCDDLASLVVKLKDDKNNAGHKLLFDEFFRERSLAADGAMPSGKSFLGLALNYQCEALALSVMEQLAAASKLVGDDVLRNCVWSDKLVRKLLDDGYAVRKQLQENHEITIDVVVNGTDKVVKLLATQGLPLEQFHLRSKDCTLSYSTLLYTADHSNNGNVLALLQAGSSPGVCDRNGDTFLHKVLKNRSDKRADWIDTNYIDGFRKLLKHCTAKKIPLDVANRDGQTALHVAAKRGYINSALALLKCGADPGIKDGSGSTPADLAALAGHRDIAHALSVHLAHQRVQEVLAENGRAMAALAPRHAST